MKKILLVIAMLMLATANAKSPYNPYANQAFSACVYGWSVVWLDNQDHPGHMTFDSAWNYAWSNCKHLAPRQKPEQDEVMEETMRSVVMDLVKAARVHSGIEECDKPNHSHADKPRTFE